MAKKSVRHAQHETNAKAVLSLIVLLLAFGIMVVFYNNKENIIDGGSFQQFIMLAGIGMIFLIGLLFLANPKYKK